MSTGTIQLKDKPSQTVANVTEGPGLPREWRLPIAGEPVLSESGVGRSLISDVACDLDGNIPQGTLFDGTVATVCKLRHLLLRNADKLQVRVQ